jgi:hypothetical protein
MIILGADPYYYASELEKTQPERTHQQPIDQDYAVMDAVSEHHRIILEDAKAAITGRVMLLATTPTNSTFINKISLYLNGRLKLLCDELGVTLVDWWSELADGATGLLRADLAANAYPGDVHFTLAATKRFIELLKADGVYGAEVEPSASYSWTHVFECSVDASEKTRIWSEPSVTPKNAVQSDKIAAAHLGGHLADVLACLLLERDGQTALMLNVRDGFLPIAIPPQLQSGILAFTDTEANLQTSRQVADFYGRTDIELRLSDELNLFGGQAFDRAAILIWPDTAGADMARARIALDTLSDMPSVLVGTPFPDRVGELGFGDRPRVGFNISNRLIPEQWRDYSLFVFR